MNWLLVLLEIVATGVSCYLAYLFVFGSEE